MYESNHTGTDIKRYQFSFHKVYHHLPPSFQDTLILLCLQDSIDGIFMTSMFLPSVVSLFLDEVQIAVEWDL